MTAEPAAARTGPPQGAADRVAAVHRQSRRTLGLAAVFVVVAPAAAALPHDTGSWLPLHLFLVGGLLGAIVAATQLLAVTWSASPAPSDALSMAQRVLLALGAVAIAAGRELDVRVVVGGGGVAVVAALLLVVASLARIRRDAVTHRFRPAIDAYLCAIAFGIAGSAIGATLASGGLDDAYVEARDSHVVANALGLVGIVIAGTLPYFVATQARMKTSHLATPARVHLAVRSIALATAVAVLGELADLPEMAAVGLWAYAIGVAGIVALLPRVGRKQLDWAGPRLLQLGAGVAWWTTAVVLLGAHELSDGSGRDDALRLLVIGGYAQILYASLAYFGPVLLGGGHQRLTAGFRVTRSWVALLAANAAAIGVLAHWDEVVAAALAVWLADALVRAGLLVRLARSGRRG